MQKIMFNDKYGLTKAVLEGRKTMTRRLVPEKLIKAIEGGVPGFAVMESKYKVGEVVAVAEAYKDVPDLEPQDLVLSKGEYVPACMTQGWANKEFVRADIMPERLRITNVRVERLQEISDEDCIREGIYKKTLCPPGDIDYFYHSEPRSKWEVYSSPREAFAALIDKVSGKGTWESNPWVFVYEFELEK